MRFLFKYLLLFLFFSLGTLALGSELSREKRCEITVIYHLKTGVSQKSTYSLRAKSKSDCKSKTALYAQNTTPQKTKKKEVRFKWKE